MNELSLSIYFRDLSNMLVSGIGLEHSLRTLSETALDERARWLCRRVLTGLEKGESMGAALLSAGILPREAVMAISAGETAGEVPMVLSMLGDYFELKSEMKNRVLSSLGYPATVIGILLCVLVYMAVDVLPKVAELLPIGSMSSPLTVVLLSAALFFRSWGVLTGVVLILIVAGLILLVRCRPTILKMFICRLPIFGQLMKEQELSLGFFALYVLQKSGLPLEAALREAALVAGGTTAIHFQDCSSYLVGGLAFSEAVRRDRYFPLFTADTLRIGEESGRFEEYFERLYRVFYRMFRSRMDQLTGSVRPLMLLFSGIFIALIALGILQPLYGNLANIALP